mmetsp:Transcript_46931/g.135699  ORF Transcript_46931/g.135699 Transcript_46931/m.135699 type:complete len:233 (-) Transcript_46931:356-1054(-)
MEPAEPIVSPLASRLQVLGQSTASLLHRAPTIAIVAIKVPNRKARVLRCAPVAEYALASAWDLDVEAVRTRDVLANVGDLYYHCLVDQERVGTAPNSTIMHLVQESELVALSAIVVTCEPMIPTHRCCSKSESQVCMREEGLVLLAAPSTAAVTHRPLTAIGEHVSCAGVACEHWLVHVALAWPSTAGLAAIPVTCGPCAFNPRSVLWLLWRRGIGPCGVWCSGVRRCGLAL